MKCSHDSVIMAGEGSKARQKINPHEKFGSSGEVRIGTGLVSERKQSPTQEIIL